MYKKLLTSITALTLVAGVGLIASPEQSWQLQGILN